MNRFIILISIIVFCYCSQEECENSSDEEKWNSIAIEHNELYCFKAKVYGEKECIPFPKKAEEQKIFVNMVNGLIKKIYSFYGSYWKHFTELFSDNLLKTSKDSYNLNEVVEIEKLKSGLSEEDKNILFSNQTCSYLLLGRFYFNPTREYPSIKDKNTCFNAKQPTELKNIIDCGYANFKFSVDGKDYEFNSCYLIPTNTFPKYFSESFMESLGNFESIMMDNLFKYLAGMNIEEPFEEFEERRLSEITYNIEVENKDGRKIKYSSDNKLDFEVIAEGSGGAQTSDGNKSSYFNLNLIFLILLLFL